MTYTPPPGPPDAPLVFQVGAAFVACDPDPGRPAAYFGEPGSWEPAEEPTLGPTYLLLKSKDRWVPLDLDYAPHLREQVWGVFQCELEEARASYEVALYGE